MILNPLDLALSYTALQDELRFPVTAVEIEGNPRKLLIPSDKAEAFVQNFEGVDYDFFQYERSLIEAREVRALCNTYAKKSPVVSYEATNEIEALRLLTDPETVSLFSIHVTDVRRTYWVVQYTDYVYVSLKGIDSEFDALRKIIVKQDREIAKLNRAKVHADNIKRITTVSAGDYCLTRGIRADVVHPIQKGDYLWYEKTGKGAVVRHICAEEANAYAGETIESDVVAYNPHTCEIVNDPFIHNATQQMNVQGVTTGRFSASKSNVTEQEK